MPLVKFFIREELIFIYQPVNHFIAIELLPSSGPVQSKSSQVGTVISFNSEQAQLGVPHSEIQVELDS